MKKIPKTLVTLLGVCCYAAFAGCSHPLAGGSTDKADFYVSPAGNDSWSGTLPAPDAQRSDGPFRTPARARDEVRILKRTKPQEDITVLIRGGTYYLKETVVFGLKDSASKGHFVTYAAYPGEEPVFSSGVKIEGWKKLKDYPDALPPGTKTAGWPFARPRQCAVRLFSSQAVTGALNW